MVETANWFSKGGAQGLSLGLNLTGNAVDDPDQSFYENYSCGSERNYTNYCNKDIEKLFGEQSAETDVAKRKKLVWEIDKKLQEDVARPIIYPRPHGLVLAALRQGHHHHGEQLLQRLSLRRRLDGQVALPHVAAGVPTSITYAYSDRKTLSPLRHPRRQEQSVVCLYRAAPRLDAR